MSEKSAAFGPWAVGKARRDCRNDLKDTNLFSQAGDKNLFMVYCIASDT
jgi:hypothetical protein